MDNIAIIPARGGSKRLPGKNIKDFLGKPIIAYSVEAALQSGLFEEVMVSTDDDRIAETAVKYGAVVPFRRSTKNSDDFATTSDVLLEVLDQYTGIGKSFIRACCIYATAPFVTAKKIQESYKVLVEKRFDSVFAVLKFNYPIQRALQFDNEQISMVEPAFLNSRSQDLPVRYHDSGQFYWFNTAAFKLKKKIFTDNSGAIILPDLEAQDIDDLNDWQLAEQKYQLLYKNKEQPETHF